MAYGSVVSRLVSPPRNIATEGRVDDAEGRRRLAHPVGELPHGRAREPHRGAAKPKAEVGQAGVLAAEGLTVILERAGDHLGRHGAEPGEQRVVENEGEAPWPREERPLARVPVEHRGRPLGWERNGRGVERPWRRRW